MKAFAIRGREPLRVAVPATIDELAATLGAADAAGDGVVLFGGGTLQALGNAPARYDLAVDLRSLASVIEYSPADMTIAVECGMTVRALEKTLAAERQFVPLDAPRSAKSTVGGVLATGWCGPRHATYGRPRDLLIGATVALADGTIARSGGMVVKNVSGYDVGKLYAGSLGTLAALWRANFKALPLPPVQRLAIAALPERSSDRAIAHLAALECEPTAALAITGFKREIPGPEGVEGRAIVLFEGSQATIDRATRDLRSQLGAAGVPETTLVDRGALEGLARVVDAYVSPLGSGRSVTYRSSGVPSDLALRVWTFATLATEHRLALETIRDLRSGDAIFRVSAPSATALAERIVPFDDAIHDRMEPLVVLDAPDPVHGELNVWGTPPAAIDAMRALKERFDPKKTLAPGRFVAGI